MYHNHNAFEQVDVYESHEHPDNINMVSTIDTQCGDSCSYCYNYNSYNLEVFIVVFHFAEKYLSAMVVSIIDIIQSIPLNLATYIAMT